MKQKKVLVSAYGGGHIGPLIPVIKNLEAKNFLVETLALTSAITKANEANINYKTYVDYIDLLGDKKQEALEYGATLAKVYHNPDSGIPLEESIAYLGVNYHEMITTYGEDLANKLFGLVGRHAFYPIEFLKMVLKEVKPHLVLTTNSPKSERALISAANELNIKSLRFEDLFIDTNVIDENISKLGKELYYSSIGKMEIKPTKVLVMSEYSKELYKKNAPILGLKTPLSDVVVVGQPILESVEKQMQQKQSYNLLPNRSDKITLCWTHQNVTPDQDGVFNIIYQWFETYSENYNLVIKLHPNSVKADLENIKSKFSSINKYDNLRLIQFEVDSNEVLWNSDLVIAQESTMLMQACFMGKPVFILDPKNLRTDSPYVKATGAPFIRSAKDLDSNIKKISRKITSQKSKNAFGIPKNPSQNISDLIQKILI